MPLALARSARRHGGPDRLPAERRRRQRGQRQAAVRRQVRRLPHPRARRHQGRRRAEPRRGVPARRARTASAQATFEGIVHRQILHPNRLPQVDPVTGKELPLMPAKLVTGEDAQDVAAYVAAAAAKHGQGHGRARAGRRRQGQGHAPRRRTASSTIPADPTGALAYTFAQRRRPRAGQVDDRVAEQVLDRPRHRDRGQRRRREGRGRQERRRLEGQGRPQARRVHVLLLRARPPRGRHGGQAHRQVSGAVAPRRRVAARRVVLLAARARRRTPARRP